MTTTTVASVEAINIHGINLYSGQETWILNKLLESQEFPLASEQGLL